MLKLLSIMKAPDESENYARKILDVLPDGIITMFPDGQISHINSRARKLLNISDALGTKHGMNGLKACDLFALLHEGKEILPQVLDHIARDKQTIELSPDTCIQEKTSHTLFPVKGQFFIFRITPETEEVIFYFQNITTELSQQYILNTALKRSKIYPWFLDIDRGVFVLDPRYFEYLKFPPRPDNTLTMEEYVTLVHPDDRETLREAFEIQFSGNKIYEKPLPFRLRRGDGEWEWFEGQSTYIGKLSGLPYRLVGICMSIQEHKNIEESLTAARNKAEESDRLKSAFLANMSHEIRTPLNAIVGFSDVLSATFEELTPEEREEFVSLIRKNSEQLLVLISDILDLSRIESNTMEFVFTLQSLNAIFKDIYQCHKVNNHSDVTLHLQIPEEEISIVTDPARLKQVINNLINNALKFTPRGSIYMGFSFPAGERVELFVKDTGEGIPEEHLPHIFERFYKVNTFKQGTGLGLSICKTIVESLKGHLAVSSKVNNGTTFKITLPLKIG